MTYRSFATPCASTSQKSWSGQEVLYNPQPAVEMLDAARTTDATLMGLYVAIVFRWRLEFVSYVTI